MIKQLIKLREPAQVIWLNKNLVTKMKVENIQSQLKRHIIQNYTSIDF